MPMSPGLLGKASFKVGLWRWRRFKRKKGYNYEKLIEPLLEEVARTSEGEFPGEYGDRSTEWEGIEEPVRLNAPNRTIEYGDEYQHLLEEIATKENARVELGRQIISHLPGGIREGNQFKLITGAEEIRGQPSVPRVEPVKGDLDQWLEDCWTAFEESTEASELEPQIRSLARKHETSFEMEGIECWENDAGHPNWPEDLWHLYDTGNLQAYHRNHTQIESYRQELVKSANLLRSDLEKLN